MKIFSRPLMLAGAMLMICYSCNYDVHRPEEKNQDQTVMNVPPEENQLVQDVDTAIGPIQTNNKKSKGPGPSSASFSWDKRIVKTGNLNIEAKDYKAYSESLRAAVKQTGAYIAQEQQQQSGYKIENTITIKVPVERFDELISLLSPPAEKVLERKITSEDVTGEVVDTKSRMEAKKEVRQRYLDLLKQAHNMKEILEVQHEINEIQEQIESASGRSNYLSHAAAFSTIYLTYYQVLDETAANILQPSFGEKFLLAFKNGGAWLAEVVIALVTLWPFWLLLVTGIAFFKKWKRLLPKQTK